MKLSLSNVMKLAVAMASTALASADFDSNVHDHDHADSNANAKAGLRASNADATTARKLVQGDGQIFFDYDRNGILFLKEQPASTPRNIDNTLAARAAFFAAFVDNEAVSEVDYDDGVDRAAYTTDVTGLVQMTICDSRTEDTFLFDEGHYTRFSCLEQTDPAIFITTEKPIKGLGFFSAYESMFTSFTIETSQGDGVWKTYDLGYDDQEGNSLCYFGIKDDDSFTTIKFTSSTRNRFYVDTLAFVGGSLEDDEVKVTLEGIPTDPALPSALANQIEFRFRQETDSYRISDPVVLTVGREYQWRAISAGIAGPWQRYTAGPSTLDVSAAFTVITMTDAGDVATGLDTAQIRGSDRILVKDEPFTIPVGVILFWRLVSPYAAGGTWNQQEIAGGSSSELPMASAVTTVTPVVTATSQDGSLAMLTLLPFGDESEPVPLSSDPIGLPRGSRIRYQVVVNDDSKVTADKLPNAADYELDTKSDFTKVKVVIPDSVSASDVKVYLNRFAEPFAAGDTAFLTRKSLVIVLTKIELGDFTSMPRATYAMDGKARFTVDTTELFNSVVTSCA